MTATATAPMLTQNPCPDRYSKGHGCAICESHSRLIAAWRDFSEARRRAGL